MDRGGGGGGGGTINQPLMTVAQLWYDLSSLVKSHRAKVIWQKNKSKAFTDDVPIMSILRIDADSVC